MRVAGRGKEGWGAWPGQGLSFRLSTCELSKAAKEGALVRSLVAHPDLEAAHGVDGDCGTEIPPMNLWASLFVESVPIGSAGSTGIRRKAWMASGCGPEGWPAVSRFKKTI